MFRAAATCLGIGFQRGTHIRWKLVANDASGAPTLRDMGASFAIATGGVLTLFIAAPPDGTSVWARVVDEVSSEVFVSPSRTLPQQLCRELVLAARNPDHCTVVTSAAATSPASETSFSPVARVTPS